MFSSIVRAAVLTVAMSLSVFGTATAEEQPGTDLILILDASNSMWGQIDGKNKIVIAREAVGGLIDELPQQQNVGLIAYGHRREGDCDDIEVLQDVTPVNKPQLKSTINAINPKGRTPITSSIQAALDLARQRESTSIVLVSDGLETCDLDPCGAVKAAKAEGVPFILHVVGFDIAGEDTSQLECAAQEGDGVYLSAESAPQLSEALQSAYEKPTVPDGRLLVTATAEGKLQDAVISVRDLQSGKQIASGRTYVSAETNPRRIPLDDGSYIAEVSAVRIKGAPTFSFEFEILDGNQIERSFDYSAGEITVKVTRNDQLSDATVSIRSQAEGAAAIGGRTYSRESHNPMVKRISAGTYDVTIRSVEMRHAPEHVVAGVQVTGGERTDLSHDFTSGTLSVGTRRGEQLVDSVVNVIDSAGKNVGGGRTYASDKSNPKQFILPPGEYTIRIAEIRGVKLERSATVAVDQTAELLIDLDRQF